MEIIIERPPRTMREVYEMLPEGTLAELINNQIYMSPAPLFNHQRTIQSIYKELDKIVEGGGKGIVLVAPFDIRLDSDRNTVQPDIIVILKTNLNQINKDGRYFGVPDLLVEVLSPNNKEYDLITKKNLYEKFGVREYWVIDPETKQVLGFELKSGVYERISDELGTMNSSLLGLKISF